LTECTVEPSQNRDKTIEEIKKLIEEEAYLMEKKTLNPTEA